MGLPVGERVGLTWPSSAQSPVHASSFQEGESVGDKEGSSVGLRLGLSVLCAQKRLSYDVKREMGEGKHKM